MSSTFTKPKEILRIALISLAFLFSANSFACPGYISSPNKLYFGAFGGGGTSNTGNIQQTGTALFSAGSGGPLAVNANGSSNNQPAGLVGLHLGYEWAGWLMGQPGSHWNLIPAAEVEGYYLGVKQRGAFLSNPTTRLPEHTFKDIFPMDNGVFLANSVWTFKIPCWNCVDPYIGVGIGAAFVDISGAYSLQENFAEPGINHFNSNPNATTWTFAAQGKLGLRYNLCHCLRLFAEYRYLYLAPTSYTFGSTVYPTHVATTSWNVHLDHMNYNMGALGIEYSF